MAYKAAEVCEMAHIQSYVLRSWESEFPRMGVLRDGIRVYRQADIEQVLRIKQLVFEEGLTLAGARRRIEEDTQPQAELPLEEFVTPELRHRIGRVKKELQDLLGLLGGAPPGTATRIADVDQAGGDGKSVATTAAAHATVAKTRKKRAASPREKAKARPRRHVGRA